MTTYLTWGGRAALYLGDSGACLTVLLYNRALPALARP